MLSTTLWMAVGGGLAVGALLGTLGAGGSMLTLPLLVVVFKQPVPTAAATSLLVVAIIAASAAVGHARGKNVRFRPALALSALAAVGSYFGTLALRRVSAHTFLWAFAGLLALGAVALWRTPKASMGKGVDCFSHFTVGSCFRLVTLGLSVGLLTGFFGVGGGFLVVPALVLGLGFGMREAVGTSLVVVAVAALTGFVSHLGTQLPWGEVAPFALAGAVGAVGGQRAGLLINTLILRRAFSIALLLLSGGLVARELLA